MKEIKSFEDACKALNIPATLPDVSSLPEEEQKGIIAHYKLTVITRALNEGWEPDWTDDTWKYWPWFRFTPGVGFSFCGFGGGDSGSLVGSRLCFKSRALAEYAGKQFQDLYNDFLSK